MDAPLYNHLIQYNKAMTSFHMPGHKFGKKLEMDQISLLDLDLTEVPGLDNLYDANGIIMQAQKKMAQQYKAKETIFLTNGSTTGIIASMMAVCRPGESLIIARNSHHSVWNGLILGGIHPIYVNPRYDTSHHILGGVCIKELEEILIAHPEAKGVVIVSPTYEGFVSNMKEITQLVHQYKKLLIVDEAHGAHFVWNQRFPKSALELGADLVIQSMHKTLPTLTQSALLHIGSKKIDKEIVIQCLQMIQTSSPSYVMMGLMDYTRAYMKQEENLWDEYLQWLVKVRVKLRDQLEHLILLSKADLKQINICDIDITKLVIYTSNSNITGIELGKILREKYCIQVEVEAKDYIIAMSTIGDTLRDLEKFSQALLEIDASLKKCTFVQDNINMIKSDHQEKTLPREAFFAVKELISMGKCHGRVSAANIMLYPPGIPLVCIGERFSKEMVCYIEKSSQYIQGIHYEKNDMKVYVTRED